MKRYIKPNTDIVAIELYQMIAGSPGIDPNTKVDNPSVFDSKGFETFTDDATPIPFSIWDE